MKTSELIKQLRLIEKGIPFDAEVVTGDDWMPSELVRVFHEPPHTFLEFKGVDGFGPADREVFDDTQLPLVHAYISSLLLRTQSKELNIGEAAEELLGFVTYCQSHSPSVVIEKLRTISGGASG